MSWRMVLKLSETFCRNHVLAAPKHQPEGIVVEHVERGLGNKSDIV